MNKKKALNRYIEETLGESIEWRTGPTTSGLPLYLKMSFHMSRGQLMGSECIFLFVEKEQDLSVITLEKRVATLRKRISLPFVLVFEELPGRTTERLVKRRIPFVVIGRQIFLPHLLMHLRKEPTRIYSVYETKPLSPTGETILIGQLLDGRFESKSGAEVAKIMNDSAMMASKAIRELEERGLCKLRNVGRRKLLTFEDRDSLWQSARKILRNPIQMIKYSNRQPDIPWSISGISALSKQSMLAEDRQQTIAVYRRDLCRAKQTGRLLSQEPDNLTFRIEVWNRKPWLLSKEEVVDPISLYLIFRTESDDRIQIEIEGLMKQIGLPIHGESNG